MHFRIGVTWTLDVTSSYDMRTLLAKGHRSHVKSHFPFPCVRVDIPAFHLQKQGWGCYCSLVIDEVHLEWGSWVGSHRTLLVLVASLILWWPLDNASYPAWWCLGGGGGGTDRTEIFLPLFYVPINQRWSLSSFENCLQSLSHLSIWGWFCLVEFLPPSHFAAKCWFLLSWRARFAFDAPLLSESYIPLMWVICLCVLLNYGFGYLDVSHSMLLAVGKEQRLAVKACSAILPTLGNRHWHLLCSRYWPCQQSQLW